MGLFFEQRAPSTELVQLISKALKTEPPAPAEASEQAVALTAELLPVTSGVTAALLQPVPANPDTAAVAQAQAITNQLLGGSSFNTGRFLVALAMFLSLIGGGIATEATHLTTASGTLFGFAGAIFGIVTAFLGSEKGGS